MVRDVDVRTTTPYRWAGIFRSNAQTRERADKQKTKHTYTQNPFFMLERVKPLVINTEKKETNKQTNNRNKSRGTEAAMSKIRRVAGQLTTPNQRTKPHPGRTTVDLCRCNARLETARHLEGSESNPPRDRFVS